MVRDATTDPDRLATPTNIDGSPESRRDAEGPLGEHPEWTKAHRRPDLPRRCDSARGRLVEKNLEYRARAAECAARVKEATDPRIKAFNQAEAETWLRRSEER